MSILYVSNTSANGVGKGSVKGDGSKAHPFGSIEQALAVEKNGDVLRLNGTFHESVTLQRGVALEPVAKGSAVIDGTVTVAVRAGQAITIGAIKIDARNAKSAIMLDTEGAAYSVTLRGTDLDNATGYAISGGPNLKASLTTSGVNYKAVTSQGFVGLLSLASGAVNITGGNISVSHVVTGKEEQASNQVGAAVLGQIVATRTGVSVRVDGVTAKGSIEAKDNSVAGLQIMNVPKASIEDNTITLTGYSSKAMRGIAVTYNFLHPLDSSGAVIKGNTVVANDPGRGVLFYIGANGTSGPQGYADNATVYGNIGIGNASAAQVNDLHGVLVGDQSGARVEDNQMTNVALAYAMKDDFGSSLVKDNTDNNTAETVWYNKGSTGVSWIGNKSIQDGGHHPVALYVGPDLDEADGGDYESSVTLVEGNMVQGIVRHGAVITAGSTVTFAGGKVVDGPLTLDADGFAKEQGLPSASASVVRFAQAAAAFAPTAAVNLGLKLGAPSGMFEPGLSIAPQTRAASDQAERSLAF